MKITEITTQQVGKVLLYISIGYVGFTLLRFLLVYAALYFLVSGL